MTTYKNVWKIQRSNLYLTFLFSEFINMVLVAFADTVFVTCANTLSDTFRILWQTTTESSARLNYLIFSQIHVLGFQH